MIVKIVLHTDMSSINRKCHHSVIKEACKFNVCEQDIVWLSLVELPEVIFKHLHDSFIIAYKLHYT